MIVPRVHSPVRQLALLSLRNAIIEGQFKPGDRLIERELCQLTEVSRTSVREVLRLLEAEGIVEVIPQEGPTLAVVTLEDVKDLYRVRQVLEGLACRFFAEQASPTQITALARAVGLYKKACYEGNSIESIRAKNEFYDIIFKGCNR